MHLYLHVNTIYFVNILLYLQTISVMASHVHVYDLGFLAQRQKLFCLLSCSSLRCCRIAFFSKIYLKTRVEYNKHAAVVVFKACFLFFLNSAGFRKLYFGAHPYFATTGWFRKIFLFLLCLHSSQKILLLSGSSQNRQVHVFKILNMWEYFHF